jgi:uncharacterized membrane protein YhaH (DUF805 family)
MVSFGVAIKLGFQKYFQFSGTATRAEYWWFALFAYIVGLAAGLVDTMVGLDSLFGDASVLIGGPLTLVTSLVFFVPQLSILVRRFRDAGVSPYWLISGLVPIAGFATWCSNHLMTFMQLAIDLSTKSEAEVTSTVEALANDPSMVDALKQFLVISLLLSAFGIFQFVVTLLRSRSPKQPVVATTDY